jgi:predicted translin family RNA/ssDNA-binding protein
MVSKVDRLSTSQKEIQRLSTSQKKILQLSIYRQIQRLSTSMLVVEHRADAAAERRLFEHQYEMLETLSAILRNLETACNAAIMDAWMHFSALNTHFWIACSFEMT